MSYWWFKDGGLGILMYLVVFLGIRYEVNIDV